MSVSYLKISIYNVLDSTLNKQFDRKQKRPYFYISGLTYKGRTISVAVPYESNINKFFQKKPKYIVQTSPTLHTKPGNIAGWHILKIIPSYKMFFYKVKASGDIIDAEKIANQQYSKMKTSAQNLLNLFEFGKYPFGSNEFDKALQEMDKLVQQQKVVSQYSTVLSQSLPEKNISSSQTQQAEMNTKPLEVDEKTQAVADCLAETLTNPKKKKLLIKNGKLRLAPLSKALSLKSYELDKSILTEFEKLKNPIEDGATEELSKLLIKYIKRSVCICKLAKPFSLDKEKFHEPELDEQNN